MSDFETYFESLTTHRPFPWQAALAGISACRSKVIRIPTGLGKTEGILAAWSFHRLEENNENWPRRIVWCLPMRGLVEQTEQVAIRMAERVSEADRPEVHVVMGGEDAGEWFLSPERPAILIGTQDMLLSRALNRGYASPRARWPMEFGLLNQDALWVMDEVQLMDVGLATSAQLQGFRDFDPRKHLRPCQTWWMSATLQPVWLRTVDTAPHHGNWLQNPCKVAPEHQTGDLWEVQKSVETTSIDRDRPRIFAERILSEHHQLAGGEFGKITLVVCNTVKRACETFDALRKLGRSDGLELVHSRFRPHERIAWRTQFLSRSRCTAEVDRIIVATQVVEAGVDISAGCLITELAPWPSLVQRFGRCARYGGFGKVLVVDRGRREKLAAPYRPEELEIAWTTIQQLSDVGIKTLELHEESLTAVEREQLYPYSPEHLLLQNEFEELFDTTPDLTGADLDISRFIRSGDERDLQVFWIDVPQEKKGEKLQAPSSNRKPLRNELCAVPFLSAREWLCGKGKTKLKPNKRAWVWDWLDGKWEIVSSDLMLPGRIVCVAADSGGYSTERGFSPDSTTPVSGIDHSPVESDVQKLEEADNRQDGEQLSYNPWKTIACHTKEVSLEVNQISRLLDLPEELQNILNLAALWHDWGKAHPAFQGSIRDGKEIIRLKRLDLAKAPKECWPRKHRYQYLDDSETRRGLRHELASALGLFAIVRDYAPQHPALLGPWAEVFQALGRSEASSEVIPAPSPMVQRVLNCSAEDFDLLLYLVASHHGKVRVALHAAPDDQEYRDRDGRGLPIRGIREGDCLPSVVLFPGEPALPEMILTLSPAAIGLSEQTGISWRERCSGVIERYGPTTLAFLEAVLRAADVRASRLETNDPLFATEANS